MVATCGPLLKVKVEVGVMGIQDDIGLEKETEAGVLTLNEGV